LFHFIDIAYLHTAYAIRFVPRTFSSASVMSAVGGRAQVTRD